MSKKKACKPKTKKRRIGRSSSSGRFVSEEEVKSNPKETTTETV